MAKNNKGIILQLNKLTWEILRQLLLMVTAACPVEDFQIESFVMGEMYRERIEDLTFFEPGEGGKMAFYITYSQAYALNMFWAGKSKVYNLFLRDMIEPYLPVQRDFKYDDDQLNIEIDN